MLEDGTSFYHAGDPINSKLYPYLIRYINKCEDNEYAKECYREQINEDDFGGYLFITEEGLEFREQNYNLPEYINKIFRGAMPISEIYDLFPPEKQKFFN